MKLLKTTFDNFSFTIYVSYILLRWNSGFHASLCHIGNYIEGTEEKNAFTISTFN